MTREEYIEQIELYNAAPLENKEKIPTKTLNSIYQSMLYPQRRIDGQKFSFFIVRIDLSS